MAKLCSLKHENDTANNFCILCGEDIKNIFTNKADNACSKSHFPTNKVHCEVCGDWIG